MLTHICLKMYAHSLYYSEVFIYIYTYYNDYLMTSTYKNQYPLTKEARKTRGPNLVKLTGSTLHLRIRVISAILIFLWCYLIAL